MKYSVQRETILNIIKDNHYHLSAISVYNEARKIIPNISLGTVYRNLNNLVDSGQISYIKLANDDNRFDCTVTSHSHLHCVKCNNLYDISNDLLTDFKDKICKSLNHEIILNSLVFEGVCSQCRKEEEKWN